MGPPLRGRIWDRCGGWLVGFAAGGLLLWSCAQMVERVDYRESYAYRRLWNDMTFAINELVDSRFPVDAGAAAPARNPLEAYRSVFLDRTERLRIEPWQFWRSFRPWIFRPYRGTFVLEAHDDAGRAVVLAAAFAWLGGVSPYLILWLAALAAFPAVAWCVAELWASGRRIAAVAFGGFVVTSPFVGETLVVPRYAVGFYVAASLAVMAVTVYAAAGRLLTVPRLAARFAAAGLLLAVCVSCRSSSLFLGGGLVAAAFVGARRVAPRRHVASSLLATGLVALALGPALLLRPAQHHTIWAALWEGLGDFDRTKGAAWSDPATEALVRREGASGLWTVESEAILRRHTLNTIREDPAWYSLILVKRVAATITQWKLWPFGPVDGLHIRRRTSENEAFIDKYYGYTTTADHVGFGRLAKEIPVQIWPFLTALLFVYPRFVGSAAEERRKAWRAEASVLVIAAVTCLALPVFVTTAGAQETQAFVLVYFLATAFLAQRLAAGPRKAVTEHPQLPTPQDEAVRH